MKRLLQCSISLKLPDFVGAFLAGALLLNGCTLPEAVSNTEKSAQIHYCSDASLDFLLKKIEGKSADDKKKEIVVFLRSIKNS